MIAEGVFTFLKRGAYDRDRSGNQLTWQDGQPIEYVDLYDVDAETMRRASVSQHVEGELPTAPGASILARLRVSSNRETGRMKLQLVAVGPAAA